MKIVFRKFQQKDLIPINNWANNSTITNMVIDSEIFAKHHSLAMTQEFLDSCNLIDDYQKIFVVADKNTSNYLGQVRIYEINKEKQCCKIDIVIGDPKLFRKGIGKKAIVKLIQIAQRDFSIRKFEAEIPLENLSAIALFSSLGFNRIKKIYVLDNYKLY